MSRSFKCLALFLLLSFNLHGSQQDRIAEQSRKLHASALVLDTHIDIPNLLRPDWNFTDEHREDHVDLPRLRKGGLDAVFMSIYMSGTVIGSSAVNDALELIAAVRELAEDLPAEISLCTTADEVRRAHREGKVAVLLGMEGGHMINNSLPILRTYARLGVRSLTLTHSVNTDWADSSGDQPKHKGLTEFGRQVVHELNRLGVMIDISHVADTTFWNALEISRAPMIASHSSSRAIARHHRNMTDEMMKALAAKGGVIQINYAVQFLDDARAQYSLRSADRQRALERQFPGRQNANRRQAEIVRELRRSPLLSRDRQGWGSHSAGPVRKCQLSPVPYPQCACTFWPQTIFDIAPNTSSDSLSANVTPPPRFSVLLRESRSWLRESSIVRPA